MVLKRADLVGFSTSTGEPTHGGRAALVDARHATESPRPALGDNYPDAKRCEAVVRLSWTYPGSPQRRARVRCERRKGHAGDTHVTRLAAWNLPGLGLSHRVLVRWVA